MFINFIMSNICNSSYQVLVFLNQKSCLVTVIEDCDSESK